MPGAMPKSLRRSSPVASKPAWRGPSTKVLDAAELDVEGEGLGDVADGDASPSSVQSSPAPVIDVERNVIVGRWATSMMSSARVWASRSALPVSIEARSMVAVTDGRVERVADDDVDLEGGEAAADLGDAEVADREADGRVGGVEGPRSRGEREGW